MKLFILCCILSSAAPASAETPPIDPVIEEPIRPLYPEDGQSTVLSPSSCGAGGAWLLTTLAMLPPARRRRESTALDIERLP